MRALDDTELLALWDRGTPRHALDRAALLAAAARPDWPPGSIADRPLGQVGASVLRLRATLFGPHIDAHADCRQCGERLAFRLDVGTLLQGAPDETAPQVADVAGCTVRAPGLRDLAAVAHLPPEEAADQLLARCTRVAAAELPTGAARAQVEAALEALDPQADLTLALHCVTCGQEGTAQLDAAALLWDELTARAGAVLREVHLLASAYGWTEPQALALSPARRAQYLGFIGASA